MYQPNDIELRSEKTRNIIGQIPPKVINIGITVIFGVVLALVVGAYFFKFDLVIKTPATIFTKNHIVYYSIDIPYNKMKYLEIGQEILITVHNEISFVTTVQNVDSTLCLNNVHSFYKIKGILDNNIEVQESIEAQAQIFTGKINIVDFIINN